MVKNSDEKDMIGNDKMEILIKKTKEIKPYERNPRKNKTAIEKTAESILKFGFNVPIIIDKNDVIIAGHTRYEAAKQIGLEELPCIKSRLEDPDMIAQFRLVDNKTAELSSWDSIKLIEELEGIKEIDMSAFEFGKFEEDSEPEKPEDFEGNLDAGVEINLEDFGDEKFEYECPWCGFKWNE